ncbi:MAG: hypothetical protein HWD59_10955 [Coxiellaceae bacterium]|nr:MAG: hypothetical protein HWD59_10955 [Coxiellaceae bacterium]
MRHINCKTIETTEEYKEKAKLIAKQASKKRGINIYAHIRLRPNKANQAAQPEEQATPSKKFPLFNWWKERSLILRAVRYVRSASKEKKKGTVSVKSPTLRV